MFLSLLYFACGDKTGDTATTVNPDGSTWTTYTPAFRSHRCHVV